MTKDLQGAIKEWEYIRGNMKSFIQQLGDARLKTKLPRKGLDTFAKHFEELIAVQNASIDGIETGSMTFNCCKEDHDYEGNLNVQELLEQMKATDSRMLEVISKSSDDCEVDWWGEKKTLLNQISWQIAHESMHLGQLIAFCHVLNIQMPKDVVSSWALSGTE